MSDARSYPQRPYLAVSAAIIRDGRHRTHSGVEEILGIRRDMNDGGKRRYSDEEILKRLENPQRPYAGPAKQRGMIWPDLHGDISGRY